MTFWFWFFVGPAIALALLSLRGEKKRARYVESRLGAPDRPGGWPAVTVIVPVKGPDEGLRENLASLHQLDYPSYELIVAARSASDIPPGVLPDGVKIVVSAEGEPGASEKIQNLNAALRLAARTS